MKKCISKLITCFLISFCFTGICWGYDSKISYFAETFKDFGFDIVSSETVDFKKPNYDQYFLFLTSEAKTFSSVELDSILSYSKFIVICDEEVSMANIDFCSLDGVKVLPEYTYSGFIPVFNNYIGGKHYIVISEEVRASPLFMKRLSEYLKAYASSEEISSQNESVAESSVMPDYTFLLKKLAIFCLVVMFVSIFLGRAIMSVIKNPRVLINKKIYLKFFNEFFVFPLRKIISVYKKYVNLLRLIFVYSAIAFVLVLFFGVFYERFRTNEALLFKFSYVPHYFFDTVTPGGVARYIDEKNFLRLVVFCSFVWVFFLAGLVALPRLISFFQAFSKLAFSRPPRVGFLKALLLISSLAILFSAFFFSSSKIYVLILVYIFSVLYLVLLAQKSSIDINTLYTKRHKNLAFMGVLILMAAILGFRGYKKLHPESFSSRPVLLIEDNVKVVVLPFMKKYESGTYFQDYTFEPTAPFFVDDYYIYSPGYTKIRNKNITSFSVDGSYLVSNPKRSDLIVSLDTNKNLRDALASKDVSTLFYIENFAYDSNSNYDLFFRIDCSKGIIDPATVTLHAYFSVGGEDSREFDVLNFPGCFYGTDIPTHSVVEYNVPVDFVYMPSRDTLVFEVGGVPEAALADFSILKDGAPLDIQFVHQSEDDPYLLKNIKKDSDFLHYYSWDVAEDFDVDLENGFSINISKVLNDMRDLGILGNPFKIWSAESPHAIVKNDL